MTAAGDKTPTFCMMINGLTIPAGVGAAAGGVKRRGGVIRGGPVTTTAVDGGGSAVVLTVAPACVGTAAVGVTTCDGV